MERSQIAGFSSTDRLHRMLSGIPRMLDGVPSFSLVLIAAVCLTVTVSLMMPVTAVAEIFVTTGANTATQPIFYNIPAIAPFPNTIVIGPGSGNRTTVASHVMAGGFVNTPIPPAGSNAFTWNGLLVVNSGTRYPVAPDGTLFDNDYRASELLLGGNFNIVGGSGSSGIRVEAGVRPGYTETVPSHLQISLNEHGLSLINSGLSVSGGSRVDVGTVYGGGFGVENSAISVSANSVVNLVSRNFIITGNSNGYGRINVGAIVDRNLNGTLRAFTNGDTRIQTFSTATGGVNNRIGNDLYFFSGVMNPIGGTGTQRISVGTGETLTLFGNIRADVREFDINGNIAVNTTSQVIKTGNGTLAFTGGQFVRSQLLDIKDGTVSFSHSYYNPLGNFISNIGEGEIKLNGVNTTLRFDHHDVGDEIYVGADRYVEGIVNGAITTGVSLQAGQAGGTINVAAGGMMTTTNTITVDPIGVISNGELHKTGAGVLNVIGNMNRPGQLHVGSLQAAGGGVRFETQGQLGLGQIYLYGTGSSLIYRGGAESIINNAIELSNGGAFNVEEVTGVLKVTEKKISGSGTLLKTGAGTLWLDMKMDKELFLQIARGTVRFEQRDNLVSRDITFGGVNTILEYTGTGPLTIGNSMILGGTALNAGGQIKVTDANAVLTVNSNITDSFSNGLRVAGTLVKTGDGELKLARPTALTGDVVIRKGKLSVISPNSFSTARGLVMERNTVFDMTAQGADQLLHGIRAESNSLGSQILIGNNALTFDLKGDHSFGGKLIGTAASKLVVGAVALQTFDTNGMPITAEPSLTIADVTAFQGSVHLRKGSSVIDANTGLPHPTLVFTSNWTPGVGSTITFDLNAGAMPEGANPILYPGFTNPLGIVIEGRTDLSNAKFRVWIDPQIKNDNYHAGHIKAADLIAFIPQNRQTLFQTTKVAVDTDENTVDVYTNFTGFSGLNARLAELNYGPLTENQLQVALNLDRTRIIPSTIQHGIMDVIAAIINAEDNTSNTAATVSNLKDILTQLGGDIHANAMYLTQSRPWQTAYHHMRIDSQMYFTGADAVARGELLRGQVPYASRPFTSMNRVWITPTYSGTSITGDGNARGGTIDRCGFQMGYDRRIKHNATAGGVLGYNQAWLKQGSEKVQLSDVRLGVYGSAMLGYYYELRSYGSIGFQNYESTRIIDNLSWLGYNSRMQATGRANGWSSALNVEVARPLFFGQCIVRPTIGLDSEYAVRDAFSETGDAIALRVGRTEASRFALKGGLAVEARTMERISVHARVFAGGQFGGDNMRVTTQFVGIGAYPVQSIRAVKSGCGFLEGGIGTRIFLNDPRTLAFHANYEGNGSDHVSFHAVSSGLTWAY